MTTKWEDPLKFRGIALDTNVMLLYLLGSYEKNQIGRYKRIIQYSLSDFEKLLEILSYYPNKWFTTSHVITQVTDLTDNYNANKSGGFFAFIEEAIGSVTDENRPMIQVISNNQSGFYKFGMADAGLEDLARSQILVITTDAPFCAYLENNGLPVVNFIHYTDLASS